MFGLDFPNPLGMAAGFDKDARVPDALLQLGFGFTEVGTLTPRPQPGNAKPRLFRLHEDRGVINRFGFNNDGHAAARSKAAGASHAPGGVVGVNIGANKDSTDRAADYVAGIETFADVASYFTVNISSPNTPGLRDLQQAAALDDLLARVLDARDPVRPRRSAPAGAAENRARSGSGRSRRCGARGARSRRRRDDRLQHHDCRGRTPCATTRGGETGGLSGAPLFSLSTRCSRRPLSASKASFR